MNDCNERTSPAASQSSTHGEAHGSCHAAAVRPAAIPAPRSFAPLDKRSIAIRLPAQGRYHFVTGIGAYEADPQLGGILRVAIADKLSPYELFFIEDQWTGVIGSGASWGCDYLLSLG